MLVEGVNSDSATQMAPVTDQKMSGVSNFALVVVAMKETLDVIAPVQQDEFANFETQKIVSVKFYPSDWENEFDVVLENGTHWTIRQYNGVPHVGDEVKYVRFEEGSKWFNQGFAEGMEFSGARFGKLRDGGWPMELPN